MALQCGMISCVQDVHVTILALVGVRGSASLNHVTFFFVGTGIRTFAHLKCDLFDLLCRIVILALCTFNNVNLCDRVLVLYIEDADSCRIYLLVSHANGPSELSPSFPDSLCRVCRGRRGSLRLGVWQ